MLNSIKITLDSLDVEQVIPKFVETTDQLDKTCSVWLIISIVILFLVFSLIVAKLIFSKIITTKPIPEAGWGGIFDDLENINESKVLYKELQRSIHPDKFQPDQIKVDFAEKLFQELKQSRYSYDGLKRIKKKANEQNLL